MRKRAADYDDDEDRQKRWIGRFLWGAAAALVASALAVVVLSVFVLPPPELAPEPEVPSGPQVIGGIEVSNAPAYTAPSDATPAASGEPGATESTAAGPATATSAAVAPIRPVELSGPALVVNSAPFEADPGTPLVAVVLDDTNAVPQLHETLFSLGMPLTVGVVVGGGGDRETASAARQAGLEVLAELPLAQAGSAAGGALQYGMPEAEAARRTETLMQRLPVAVAAAQPLASLAPPNATLLKGMLSALTPLGFAYVDHGLAPGEASLATAADADAIVGVSHFTVPADADAAAAHSVLDRASATAAREGTVVVFASPSEELILALELWGGVGSASLAAPAPLSAVILRQQGGALDRLLGAQPVPQDAAPPAPGDAEAAETTDPAPPAN